MSQHLHHHHQHLHLRLHLLHLPLLLFGGKGFGLVWVYWTNDSCTVRLEAQPHDTSFMNAGWPVMSLVHSK